MKRIATWCVVGCLAAGGARAEGVPAAAPPPSAKALYEQGLATQKMGRVDEAIALYRAAIAADPAFAPVLNHFAWLRATDPDPQRRDGAEAVRLAEGACAAAARASAGSIFEADCLDTLAAAYAEAGRFRDAAAAARRAIEVAGAVPHAGRVRDFTARLKLYEAKQAWRDP